MVGKGIEVVSLVAKEAVVVYVNVELVKVEMVFEIISQKTKEVDFKNDDKVMEKSFSNPIVVDDVTRMEELSIEHGYDTVIIMVVDDAAIKIIVEENGWLVGTKVYLDLQAIALVINVVVNINNPLA